MRQKVSAVPVHSVFPQQLWQRLDDAHFLVIQEPGVGVGFDLVGQGAARMVFVDAVVIALGIEWRVEIDEVDALRLHLLAHDGQAVAVVEGVHAHPHI